jgi:hypothetical protein
LAYTSSPEKQTYSTERIPAAYDIDLRPNSVFFAGTTTYQDAGMINLLPIKGKNPVTKQDEVHAVTRQPIHAYEVVNSDLINRGCYVWEKAVGTTYYFAVCGTGVYSSTDGITFALVDTLLTSATTPVRFTEFISATNVKSLVLVDGVEGYVYTSNAAGTKITDAQFPNPHIPFPVFLDGYLFLAKAATGDIYNSDLNDPAAWTAGSYISSEMYPDDLQAIVKINNYILAIGTQGSEFFYDAANPTASPLARYDGGSLPVGTQIPNSIASNKNAVVFVSNTSDGENSVTIIEDFKSRNIDFSFLIPALNNRLQAASNNTTAAAVRGFFFRQYGQMFYGLNFQGNTAAPNLLNPTFAFSFETGWWSELRYGTAGTAPFPVYFTTQSTSAKISTYVSGHVGNTPFFGQLEEGAKTPFSHTAEDHIVNGPAATAIYTELRTPNLDFGTRNSKTMSRFGVSVTENGSSSTTSGATVTVSVAWSDDDYSTWATARDLIFGGALQWPFITQLGRFMQRAFKLTYASTKFLRYKELEMDINKGQQ